MVDTPKVVLSVAGTVGQSPKKKTTQKGDLVSFTLAVKSSYDDGAQDTWYDVAVWNEGLQESVMAELYKGAKVAVEGIYSQRPYDGKVYHQISGARVGLVEYLSRTARTAPFTAPPAEPAPVQAAPVAAAPAPVAERDEDDLPF